ncbi:MAG TPA: serine/threonine-protein kinase [Polyangiaceae bacterium]|nr:serine/threonine-protein kinase [Polyangiaceae bacterium]
MREGPTETSPSESTEAADAAFEAELGPKYELGRLLGKGGMGRVFQARHRKLDEMVAIKLLRAELANPEFLSRFKREARAAFRVRSPHVARVMDVGELSSGVPYIVMEYLEGHDLAQWVATRGRLEPLLSVRLLLQALDALAEAHAAGIVHRDVKPANLFVTHDRDGHDFVKVLDFGLAKSDAGMDSATCAITAPGSIVGSPCYMPPEQLLDAQTADPRSDVWALGATLFELITGQPPFQAPSMPQLYTAIAHGRIPRARELATECPEAIDAVIAHCLVRVPDGRYEDGRALRQALMDAIRNVPESFSPHETLPSERPPPQLSTSSRLSVAPVISSWSPDKRLARFVRPRLLSRRTMTPLVVALVVASAMFIRVHSLPKAAAVTAASGRARPVRSPVPAPTEPAKTGEKPGPRPEVTAPAPPLPRPHKVRIVTAKPPHDVPVKVEAPPLRPIYERYP